MAFESLSSPADALSAVLRIAAIGVAIASAELLALPTFIGAHGLLVGDIPLTRRRWLVVTRWRPLLLKLLSFRGTLILVGVRLAAALVVVIQPGGLATTRWAVFAVTIATLLLRVRTPNATHASGAMSSVVFLTAAAALAIDTDRALTIALWYIAAQAWLCYFVAGSSKLTTKSWRHGEAVTSILSTVMWGNRHSARAFRGHRTVGYLVCWATMLFECSIPLTLVVPLPVTVALLGIALAFHIGAAIEMGLNNFVWMFPATYPAIIFCWYFVHGTHG
jgi:hypothetical protein